MIAVTERCSVTVDEEWEEGGGGKEAGAIDEEWSELEDKRKAGRT